MNSRTEKTLLIKDGDKNLKAEAKARIGKMIIYQQYLFKMMTDEPTDADFLDHFTIAQTAV